MESAKFSNLFLKGHCMFLSIHVMNYNNPIRNHFIPGSGKIYLSFIYGDIQKRYDDNKEVLPDRIGLRPAEKFHTISTTGKAKEIKVALEPQIWYQITKVKAKGSDAANFDLGKLLGLEQADILYEKLKEVEEPEKVLEILDLELGTYYNKWGQTTPLKLIIEFIFKKAGRVSIQEILKRFPISRSTLHNYFDIYIGLSPNFYIRLVRFNHILIKYFNKDLTIAEIIRVEGYYDYSHFKKDFEQFTGYKPCEVGAMDSDTFSDFFQGAHIWNPKSVNSEFSVKRGVAHRN